MPADSCFCHFGVTLPYLEVSWHTKEVGKFSTQAASRGGVEDNDSQGHVPHLHGVVGHFHMPDLRRRNFHCNTTQNQTNSHQNTHADRLHASSWNRRAQLVFSRRCRRNRILYGSHKQFLSILHQLYFHEFLRNLCLVDSEQTSASQTSRIACCLRIIRNWNSLTYHHTIHWSFLLFR